VGGELSSTLCCGWWRLVTMLPGVA
jgi:hypothetical protein